MKVAKCNLPLNVKLKQASFKYMQLLLLSQLQKGGDGRRDEKYGRYILFSSLEEKAIVHRLNWILDYQNKSMGLLRGPEHLYNLP